VTGLRVLDLFCGAGGFSSGFQKAGFNVTGVDVNPTAKAVFELNRIGSAITTDLGTSLQNGGYDLIIGGPPCRPWSSINTTRRGPEHDDFDLLSRFFLHVKQNRPSVFVLENVPPARPYAERRAVRLRSAGYRFVSTTVKYSDFGAPTSRHRFIMVGTRDPDPTELLAQLELQRAPAQSVREAIGHLADVPEGAVPDHVYPKMKTLRKYRRYYTDGRYGWYILDWNLPAPSFGNVVKTYTMHPSGWEGNPPRVISIREALLLMGFDRTFRFPDGLTMAARYQMAVDSVSPVFSAVLAKTLGSWLS
jgi:DNA (cytosine-5)-methyltransferase 1